VTFDAPATSSNNLMLTATPPSGYHIALDVSASTDPTNIVINVPDYVLLSSQGSVSGQVSVATPSTTTISGASDVAVSNVPGGGIAPVGELSYQVLNVPVGGSIDVVLQLPPGSNPTNVYKFQNGQYIDVSSIATISGNTVTLHLTDGGPGDEDGVANGVIVDPVIPVRLGKAGVPGPPTVSSVTPGVRTIQVAYTAPASNGGSAITGYRATCTSSNGGVTRSTSYLSLANPLVVRSLTSGATYTCTVAAHNAVGTVASVPSSAVTVPTVPGSPAVTSVDAGVHTIQVAYSAPTSNGGSPIIGYRATCTSSNGGVTRSSSSYSLANPLLVGGLSAGLTYTCTVVARNAVGTGGASVPSVAATVATVPGPPAVTSLTAGVHTIQVVYTTPASDGGSPITGYRATCTSSNGGVTRSSSYSLSQPLVLTSLSSGRTYTCTVMARNAVGTSTGSAVSMSVVVG
jgi:hypothetical protein